MSHYCFTLNNYTQKHLILLRNNKLTSYIGWGFEVGAKCGTPHLQGYMQFAKRTKFEKAKLLREMSLYQCYGSSDDNTKYITKQKGEFEEYGVMRSIKRSRQGERTDWAPVVEAIQNGESEKSIAEQFPKQFSVYNKGCKQLIKAVKTNTDKPVIYILTEMRYEENAYICDSPDELAMYDNEDTLIITIIIIGLMNIS